MLVNINSRQAGVGREWELEAFFACVGRRRHHRSHCECLFI